MNDVSPKPVGSHLRALVDGAGRGLLVLTWNREETRLRAFWRVLGQLLLLILLTLIVGLLLGSYRGTPIGQGILTLVGLAGSVLLAARWLDLRPVRDLGLLITRDWWTDFAFGCTLGILLMASIFGFELWMGWIVVSGTFATGAYSSFFLPFLGVIVLFLCVGIGEEVWMRGYLLPNVAEGLRGKRINPRLAVATALFVSSAAFGLAHGLNPNASTVSTVAIIFAGIVLGLPFVWTGSLAIPIGLHITWNISQGIIFGFPVSGTSGYPAVLALEQGGPRWWTGGDFGPEAGLIGIVILVIGAGIQYGWVSWRYGRPHVLGAIAEPPRRVLDEIPVEIVEARDPELPGAYGPPSVPSDHPAEPRDERL